MKSQLPSEGVLRQASDAYYTGSRDDLIRLIPAGATRILEVGCAAGMTGRALKRAGVQEVVGVELREDVASEARRFYDQVIAGDVEKVELPYEEGHFDCIIYGDVLEHLIDPWALLRKHSLLLRSGGAIVCSIPNVRHYKNMKGLLVRGEWEYRERGVLDRTHLRFFTRKSIETMVRDAGFEITTMIKRPSGAGWLKALNRVLRNGLIDHLVLQYLFLAVKP